jgi:hypothetical protein
MQDAPPDSLPATISASATNNHAECHREVAHRPS